MNSRFKMIKILVVDDSSFTREYLVSILKSDKEILVVGEAENGLEAVEMAERLKPGLVIMDIGMPVMDGLTATEHIMASSAVPILVITGMEDASIGFNALSRGALEVIPKSDFWEEKPKEFIKKVKLLSKVKVITHIRGRNDRGGQTHARGKNGFDKMVAIASSTGGPQTLAQILKELPPEKVRCPVVVAQHMADGFVPGLVEWLNNASKLPVKQGVHGERILAGTVYMSPSEKHMKVNNNGGRIELIEKQPSDIYHPSCNILLSSAADTFRENSIGVILTGMGDDGVSGIKKIKEAGGNTIAQDEDTSMIFGMPKAAIESGCIDKVLPVNRIGKEIVRMISSEQ